MAERRPVILTVPIDAVGDTVALPEAIKLRWAPLSRSALREGAVRAAALRDAANRAYSELGGRRTMAGWRSPNRGARLAETRRRAAAAIAAAATRTADGQPDGSDQPGTRGSDDDAAHKAELTTRMLDNMKAAEERRLTAQRERSARLAARSELVMARLERCQGSDRARRQQLLRQLHGRMARADAARASASPARQQRSNPTVHRADMGTHTPASGSLRRLIIVRGAEDWMHGLSPATAERAAALRANISSRCVQRSWRRFAAQRKTTGQLARAFLDTGVPLPSSAAAPPEGPEAPGAVPIPAGRSDGGAAQPQLVLIGSIASGSSPRHARFEDFAEKLQAPATLRAAHALLRRLAQRLAARGSHDDGAQALLRQLNPGTQPGRVLERYPVRVVLCAYMIRQHPEVVFSAVGDIEARLSAAAGNLLAALEALIAHLAGGLTTQPGSPPSAAAALVSPSPLTSSMAAYMAQEPASPMRPGTVAASSAGGVRLASLLVSFDDAWLEYLDQFVVWKGHDARSLEEELLRMAVRLERSVRLKLGRREPDGPEVANNPDLKAMMAHVRHDHALLAERISRLTGADGSARLAAALDHVRAQVAAELTAAEAEEAAAAAAEENEESDKVTGTRPRVLRSTSRSTSLHDPTGDAEALAVARAATDASGEPGSPPPAAASAAEPGEAPGGVESLSNEQMVWEMLYNPSYSLPTEDAEAAWHRAMGRASPDVPELEASDLESMTPAQLAAVIAKRARAIAERAFWDSIEWRLRTAVQGGALVTQLAPLLSELGHELAGMLRDEAASEALCEEYEESAVASRLGSRSGAQAGGANLTVLGAMMEQLAGTLLETGGAARAAEGAEAAAELRARLAAALAAAQASAAAVAAPPAPSSSNAPTAALDDAGTAAQHAEQQQVKVHSRTTSSGSPPASSGGAVDAAAAGTLAEALGAALRLLMSQLKLVKLDAANARLAGLARAMREAGAVHYLQAKLAAAWGLPPAASGDALAADTVAAALPRTAAWISDSTRAALPGLLASLEAADLLLDPQAASAEAVAGGLAGVELRSGVRRSPAAAAPAGHGRGGAAAAAAGLAPLVGGAVRPSFPVPPASWQAALRLSLLALVLSDAPAAGPALPEVLRLDAARLHDVQNGAQQLTVAAAGLLIVSQLRSAAGLPWSVEGRAAARRRLLIVLSDPAMRLSHLVTELSQLASAGASSTDAGLISEQRVRGMFTSIVDPSSAAFRSIRAGVGAALAAHLLYGRSALSGNTGAASACSAALGRVGAAALADDIADLGERLANVAAVQEAVNGHMLRVLLLTDGANQATSHT